MRSFPVVDEKAAGMPPSWSLRLFGGFDLVALPNGHRLRSLGKRERVLLAYLALSPDCRQQRRKLATLLWGDSTDETSLDNLRTCVWSVRKAIGDTKRFFISSDGESMALNSAAFDIDALKFQRLAGQSELSDLEAAAKLYSGALLDGLSIESDEFEVWRRAEAANYRDQAIDVLMRVMLRASEAGEIERATRAGTQILHLDPLHEPAVRHLMQLYSQTGRRGVAMHLYRSLCNALKTELGAQPTSATRLVFTEMSRGDSDDANVPVVSTAVPNFRAVAIAVLPFANMSGDASQEYFSDGITEEITSALAKVSNLQTIARTSAFQFKGQNQDVRVVGQTLGATHLIEGSVRKSGERVRIAAQLVRARDGVRLWTETYDRKLTDIFVIQEDIAQAIVAALRAPLGLASSGPLVPNRTNDLESYQQYLIARGLYRARGSGIGQAISILETLVAREPRYAPAWTLLARCYSLVLLYSPALFAGPIEDASRTCHSFLTKMEMAARHAIQLDSAHADGYGTLACIQMIRGKWAEAEDLFKQSLALDPNDPEILNNYGMTLAMVGRTNDAMALRERLQTAEPLVLVYNIITAIIRWTLGQRAAALAIVEAMPSDALGGFYRNIILATGYAAVGRFAEAADTLLLISGNMVSRRAVEEAAQLLRGAPRKIKSPNVPRLEGELVFVYAHLGALERVLELPERTLKIGYVGSTANYKLWFPENARLRKTKRFENYVRASGMLDYWLNRSWPDVGHSVAAVDFAP